MNQNQKVLKLLKKIEILSNNVNFICYLHSVRNYTSRLHRNKYSDYSQKKCENLELPKEFNDYSLRKSACQNKI